MLREYSIDQIRIPAAGGRCGKDGRRTPEPHFAEYLRNGNACIRAGFSYGGRIVGGTRGSMPERETRTVLIPGKLQKRLKQYIKRHKIKSGPIFVTANGKPVNRSNIWKAMKRLCAAANVEPEKVYPHNLRRLFARTFYHIKKDIAKLADVLGHSRIETTRIYIMETGEEHVRIVSKLGLVA